MKRNLTSIAVLLTLSFAACKSSAPVTVVNKTPVPEEGSSPATTTKTQPSEELEELYWARIDSAKMNFTQAEVDFMTGMIGHHAQALIMSELAPKNNASPAVQRLCSRIINAQNDEIKSMQTWLRERNQPVPEVHIDGLNLMIHGVEGHGHGGMDHSMMPGMLSQEQLVELSQAKGTEFDRLFLTYMIQHHTGAITMVKDLINSESGIQNEAAFKLASDINVDQLTEIERMKLMLAEIPSEDGEL
jgi:uncharacterized protein (DUF305 family)